MCPLVTTDGFDDLVANRVIAFNPEGLPSPLGLYDFSAGNVFSDTGLTTPCVDGGPIRSVKDISGAGNHLALPADPPATWHASGPLGGPWVEFARNNFNQTPFATIGSPTVGSQSFTFYGVGWWYGAYVGGIYGASTDSSNPNQVVLSNGTGGLTLNYLGGGPEVGYYLDPNQPHVVCIRSGTGGATLYLDDYPPVPFGPIPAHTATGWNLGNSTWGAFAYYPYQSGLYGGFLYGAEHSDAQVAGMTAWLSELNGLPWRFSYQPRRYIYHGDSRTYGYNIDNDFYGNVFAQQVAADLGAGHTTLVYGYVGALYLYNDPLVLQHASDDATVAGLIGWFGINEFLAGYTAAQVYSHAQLYGNSYKPYGFKVVLFTELDDPSGVHSAAINTYNASLRADFNVSTGVSMWYKPATGVTYADFLFDLRADPTLGATGGLPVPAWSVDGIHPNLAAHTRIAGLFEPGVVLLG